MNKLALISAFLGIGVLLVACGAVTHPAPTLTPRPAATSSPAGTLTPTPDLCSPSALPSSVSIVNYYVKAFEKYGSLAQVIPQSALPQLIGTMKDIRTAAQKQLIPPCLVLLKHDALLWMDATIQAVSAFQASPNCATAVPRAQQEVCKATLEAGAALAKKYNDDYAAELARLIGATLAAPSGTAGTTAPTQPAATSTPLVVMVINPGPNPVNLRVAPFLNAQAIGSLAANVGTTALGKTTSGDWLLIEIPGEPGKHAWVYASLVEFTNGNAGELPVMAH